MKTSSRLNGSLRHRPPERGAGHTAAHEAGSRNGDGIMTIASSHGRGWEGIEVEEVVHQVDDFSLPATSRHLLVFHLDRSLEVAEHRYGQRGILREGSLTILPAGAPTDWHLDRHGDIRHLHLHADERFLHQMAVEIGTNPDTVELLSSVGARSPEVEQIGLALLRELHSEGLGSKIYADSLTMLLGVQLLRSHSSSAHHPVRVQDGLTGVPLKRVTEYIEEYLTEDLPLATVASIVSMSPYHFTRLFRRAVGVSPHQYIIGRRLERAKLLLAATDWSLAVIAREVGFASGSHLAIHFERTTGMNPSQYR